MLKRGTAAILFALVGCGGEPCRTQADCAFGNYCAITSATEEGTCQADCQSFLDCEQPSAALGMAVCTNEGRCRFEATPPRIVLFEPEPEAALAEGVRTVRVSGEVETALAQVRVTVSSFHPDGCSGGLERSLTLSNPAEGSRTRLPFSIADLDLDTGSSSVRVRAQNGSASKSLVVPVTVACKDCPRVVIDQPKTRAAATGLLLPQLSGSADGAQLLATWRVRSTDDSVIDGVVPVEGGRFLLERLPLFPGTNRIEISSGQGLALARCSTLVTSSILEETGVRVLLGWNSPSSDLDLHIIAPNGRFGDPATSLSPRSRSASFPGEVDDDTQGFGPEVARVGPLAPGVYGIIVEPIVDGADFGSDALVRVLAEGRLLSRRPAGPRHLSALTGELWLAGVIRVEGENTRFESVDAVVPVNDAPTIPPSAWRATYGMASLGP